MSVEDRLSRVLPVRTLLDSALYKIGAKPNQHVLIEDWEEELQYALQADYEAAQEKAKRQLKEAVALLLFLWLFHLHLYFRRVIVLASLAMGPTDQTELDADALALEYRDKVEGWLKAGLIVALTSPEAFETNKWRIPNWSSLWGPYYFGVFEAAPKDMMVNWVMNDMAEHCKDCPSIAANGPYLISGLPAYPGDGSTECLSHCRCVLQDVATERYL